jgi:hypothetical protein
VIFITLLAGFVPLLQVMFFALLEDYLSGVTRCERSGRNSEDHRRDPYQLHYYFSYNLGLLLFLLLRTATSIPIVVSCVKFELLPYTCTCYISLNYLLLVHIGEPSIEPNP